MLPASVRVRINLANAAALPAQHLARSTDKRLIQAARNVAKHLAQAVIPIRQFPTAMFKMGKPATIARSVCATK